MKWILSGLMVIATTGILNAFDGDYNSTTEQVFNNVPATGAASWGSIAVTTKTAIESGFTAYASSFTQPNFGRNLVVGTTFSAYDNFVATSIINGYALITGTNTVGEVVTDSITFSASSRGVGSVPFIHISSFSVYFTSVSNINPATFNVEVGVGNKIGVDSYFYPDPLYILENDVRTTSATFNSKYGTFTPSASQNGVNDFKINYPHKESLKYIPRY